MRHVWSLIAGVLIAPLSWLLMALAFGTPDGPNDVWIMLGWLAGAGVLLGVLASFRISPVGALFTALLYATPIVLEGAGIGVGSFLRERSIGGFDAELGAPILIAGVLAAMLLMSIFSPSRWRDPRAKATDPGAWAPPPPPEPWSPPTTFPPDSPAPATETSADRSS
jgi:hypothetical protein